MSDSSAAPTIVAYTEFPCKGCGSKLSFAPGTDDLKCPHCGEINHIAPKSTGTVEEQDYLAALRENRASDDHVEVLAISCRSCGAQVSLPPNTAAELCPFCGSPIVAEQSSRKLIKPRGVLPFSINEADATRRYREWIGKLWFAPSALKRETGDVHLRGIYIPAWTYDSRTESDYTGQRGDDYWETEHYTDTETYSTTENGQSVTRTRQVEKTRQVRKTRWTYVSGHVSNAFDDLLVLATASLPPDLAAKLEPWDLPDLVPYQDEFLSGFVCETYSVDLEAGFATAQQMMVPEIQRTVCTDIGGDHQQISSLSSKYYDVTYEHILLPVWMSAYLYHGKTYRFLVNARTGEVQGQRPYSAAKIILLISAILVVVATIILLVMANQR